MFAASAPVQCTDLTFAYRRGPAATCGLNLTLRAGDLFCLLGRNGAGKTTLIRQITGELRPHRGTVTIFGQPSERRRTGAGRMLGVVPQNATLFPALSVRDHLHAFAGLKGLDGAIRRAAVAHAAEVCRLEAILARPAVQLSGGQQRMVLLALALLGDPAVLVLDEPTVGLDPVSRRTVWRAIAALRDRGKTILLTTHYLDEAEHLANRIGFLENGRLVREGSLEALRAEVGRGFRLVEPPASEPGAQGATHYFDTLGEAEAFARTRALAGYAISHVSLEDLYLRLAGAPDEPLAEAAA